MVGEDVVACRRFPCLGVSLFWQEWHGRGWQGQKLTLVVPRVGADGAIVGHEEVEVDDEAVEVRVRDAV